MSAPPHDHRSEWLLERRFGGDPEVAERLQAPSADERARLVEVWRPQAESGSGVWRMATARLWAERH